MPFKDVREFVARLEKEGEVQRIEEEVDWNLEVGAMLRRSAEKRLPAPFFQKIKDYPDGYRVFGNSVANYRRKAIALDMNPDSHPKEVIEEFTRRKHQPIKPVLVSDGPCKENIHIGDEVDLLEFPVPMIHSGDGGRYIGTWCSTISKDLGSGWVNWGMYRHMLHDKNTVGAMLMGPGQHMWKMLYRGYKPRNKPMEVAIVIGTEPISAICAADSLPYGVSEAELAGGIRGEPVELIKCETIDIEVPATAEIVIEGEIRPGEMMEEGPFGEFTGYRGAPRAPREVIRVKAVTHRNDPILTVCCPGLPGDDESITSLTRSSGTLEGLRAAGLPVSSAYWPFETSALLAVVAVKKEAIYPGIAENVAHVIWGSDLGFGRPYVIVVEDDVDPFDMLQVFHALISKCHPVRGIHILDRTTAISLCPFLSKEEKETRLGAKAYFDCTWPLEWDPADIPQRISFAEVYPLEVQQKVLDKWRKYGY